jgi:SAM-dependent methyltransferase
VNAVRFRCNICGAPNTCDSVLIDREAPSCTRCASSLRMRAVIGLLSQALFGAILAIPDFSSRTEIRGIGLSDDARYADRLAACLDYTNTYYDQEPRLDITDVDDRMAGTCDFVISSEVFEHVPPPVSRAFAGAHRLLKRGGWLVLTVPYAIETRQTREHFPTLHEWSLRREPGGEWVLENRCRDGTRERFTDLVFHGGHGLTLEMRLFSRDSLLAELDGAGFRDIRIAGDPMPEIGVMWPGNWSLPIVARA